MEIELSFEVSNGVDPTKLYNMVSPIMKSFEKNDYGTEFESIGIIPTIMSKRFLSDEWKERKQIWRKKKEADIRLFIDYYKFTKADDKGQLLLYLKCLVDSIMVIENRKKGDFQGLKLIEDILNFLNIKKEELENL